MEVRSSGGGGDTFAFVGEASGGESDGFGVIPGENLDGIPSVHLGINHVHPSASAKAVNLPKAKECVGMTSRSPFRTSSSVLHAMAVVAFAPCHPEGLPRSTTADRIVPFFALAILSKIDSWSVLNSPKPAPMEYCDIKRINQMNVTPITYRSLLSFSADQCTLSHPPRDCGLPRLDSGSPSHTISSSARLSRASLVFL